LKQQPVLVALALAASLYAVSPTPARAQEPSASPDFRVSVDRVQITAVVTDLKGRHVPDLKIGDFRVLDGGDPQQLTSCEFARLARSNPTAQGALASHQGGAAPNSTPFSSASRAEAARTLLFLVDDESLAATTLSAVHAALKSVIGKNLQPGDLAAVVRSSSGNISPGQFTSDKRLLLESAANIRWQPGSRANPGVLPQTTGPVIGEVNGASIADDSEDRTVHALRDSISVLQDLPGRKAIVLISQSLFIGTNYASRDGSRDATCVGQLVDKALRAGVVIYAADPTPLSPLIPDASYNLTSIGAHGIPTYSARKVTSMVVGYSHRAPLLLEMYRSGLRALAEGTGGQMAADTDLANALTRFTGDLQDYYLLTYKPRDPQRYFSPQPGAAPPFRSIKVEAARAGLHVRTYAGYIAPVR
jgi:VWFA-related protein